MYRTLTTALSVVIASSMATASASSLVSIAPAPSEHSPSIVYRGAPAPDDAPAMSGASVSPEVPTWMSQAANLSIRGAEIGADNTFTSSVGMGSQGTETASTQPETQP